METAGETAVAEPGVDPTRPSSIAAFAIGFVASLTAAGALFVTERAGGFHRWWWIVGVVVALPVGFAVLVARPRRRLVVGLAVTLTTVIIGIVLEQRAPIPEDRVIDRFEELALPSGYSLVDDPYVGDDAIGVGGYYVSVTFEHPTDDPGAAADEVCALLRAQGWTMRCNYDLLSSDSADQDFFDGDAEYADLWGSNGRFRVAVEFLDESNQGVLIVKTDQPPLHLSFIGE